MARDAAIFRAVALSGRDKDTSYFNSDSMQKMKTLVPKQDEVAPAL
jgi:hypothetical protein